VKPAWAQSATIINQGWFGATYVFSWQVSLLAVVISWLVIVKVAPRLAGFQSSLATLKQVVD
jgi:hypothetical protein